MKVEVIDNFEGFLVLEDEWNSLLENSQNDVVFLRHEWFRCWWETFGKNNQLFIISVKDGGELVGIAPLMISRDVFRGFPVRKLSFIKDDNSAHADFISLKGNEETIQAIVRYLKENKHLWDVAVLESILNKSNTFEYLKKNLEREGLFFGEKKELASPYIKVNSDWESFF